MRSATLVLLASLLITTVQAQDDPGKDEQKKLQGTWSVVSLMWNEKDTPKEDLASLKVVIKDNVLTIKKNDKIVGKGTIKLDPTKKPALIDYVEAKDVYSPYDCGIYQLDGTTLKWCTTAERTKRPTEFDSKQGMVFVLKKDNK